jgi:hypothetical protein
VRKHQHNIRYSTQDIIALLGTLLQYSCLTSTLPLPLPLPPLTNYRTVPPSVSPHHNAPTYLPPAIYTVFAKLHSMCNRSLRHLESYRSSSLNLTRTSGGSNVKSRMILLIIIYLNFAAHPMQDREINEAQCNTIQRSFM